MRRLFLLFLMSLAACIPHHAGDPVRRITFTVEGRPFPRALWVPQSNGALRSEMSQQRSSVSSLLIPRVFEAELLNRSVLDDDAEMLELWFAEHGYFDAHFERWEITRHGSTRRLRHSVTVHGYVTQGEPSTVRKVEITGIDALPPPLQKEILAGLALHSGRIFSSDDYDLTVATLRNSLLDHGYAYASIDGAADVYPSEHGVDISLAVSPGVESHFGKVTFVGVKDVPPEVVAAAVSFKEGDLFSPRHLTDTRSALFGLRVFSIVNLTPSLDAPQTGEVPVTIEVKGTRWRSLKLGPGVEVEGGKGTAYGSIQWENTNLFMRLWHFKQSARLGIAGVLAQDTLYTSFDLTQITVAPVVDLVTSLTVPHILGPNWSFDTDGRLQLGIEPGYQFFSPEVGPGLTWHPRTRGGRDKLSLSVGYHIRYFDYFAFTVDIQDIIDSPLGLDLTDPYLLSMLDQRLIWDGRDDKLSPTRGWYGSLALAEAGGPLFGNFNFLRAQADIRGYYAVPVLAGWNPRTVLAARLGAGIITPYGHGSRASVPYAERLYLGGGTSVRGWGADRLGPSTPVTNLKTGATELVPSGGLFDSFGNLEVRKGLPANISVAAFTDVGRVWPTAADFALSGLQWSVGGGLRYATAIGPIRGDFGLRLGPDTPDLPQLPRWMIHFGLSEAY